MQVGQTGFSPIRHAHIGLLDVGSDAYIDPWPYLSGARELPGDPHLVDTLRDQIEDLRDDLAVMTHDRDANHHAKMGALTHLAECIQVCNRAGEGAFNPADWHLVKQAEVYYHE